MGGSQRLLYSHVSHRLTQGASERAGCPRTKRHWASVAMCRLVFAQRVRQKNGKRPASLQVAMVAIAMP